VNALRKDLGLAFDDRISLTIETSGEVAEAVDAYAEQIKSETLAVELRRSADGEELQTLEIDGEPVKIGVVKR
jgi:isoleucyl-tRNA synthetase